MSLSRRQFIKASGVALSLAPRRHRRAQHRRPAACAAGSAALLESSRPAAVSTLQRSRTVVYPRHPRPRLGINGHYMGPTIRVWNGT